MTLKRLYIFLDEAGDFNFSANGTRYFLLTSVTKERPFEAFKALHDLRYDLLEAEVEVEEYFHATEDKQVVRDRVFAVIYDCQPRAIPGNFKARQGMAT